MAGQRSWVDLGTRFGPGGGLPCVRAGQLLFAAHFTKQNGNFLEKPHEMCWGWAQVEMKGTQQRVEQAPAGVSGTKRSGRHT